MIVKSLFLVFALMFLINMNESQPKKSYFIYFGVLSTTLVVFSLGNCYVWTSPVLIKLGVSDPSINPIGTALTLLESAWIVSALGLELIFGPLLSIFCLKYFLKKTMLLLVAAPLVAAHIICIFAMEVRDFIVARFLMGLGCGAVFNINIVGAFIAELSEDSNRGILGSFTGILFNVGSLFVYLIGPYLKVRSFSIINIIPLVLFYIFFGFCVPHSPYDLVKRKKNQEAKNSLIKLRMHSKVEKELEFIIKTIESSAGTDFKISDLFKNKGLFKALIICVGLMVCQQLSGVLAVTSYAQTIFELAGGAIPSAVSVIIMGLVSTISSITSCNLIDVMGRKFLLATFCILVSVSLFLLGGYFYLLDSGKDVSMISWLPIISLVVFMFGFNFGLVILPWVVMGEVFPSNAKALASTIASLTNFSLSFLVTMCFPYMVKYLGMAWTFWMFGGVTVIGSIFCLIFLPETKGKTFQEILIMLNG